MLPGMMNAVMLVRCEGWEVLVGDEEELEGEGKERMLGAGDMLTISLRVSDHTGTICAIVTRNTYILE